MLQHLSAPVQGGAPLAVVVNGEGGAVRPLLPAQLRALGGDAQGVGAQVQRHLAASPPEVSCGLLEGEDATIAGALGAHLLLVGGAPLLLTLSRWFVLPTEVQLTPPEMINRNAVNFLVIKNNHHLDKRGRITLEEDQILETKCQEKL